MKVCDILYSYETDSAKSILVGTKRRALLIDFEWGNPHIAVYRSVSEFWLKMVFMSSQLYRSDPVLLQWANKNQNLHVDESLMYSRELSRSAIDSDALRSEDGIFDAATVALAGSMSPSPDEDSESPTAVTMSLIKEVSLREVVRWKIYCGDDMDKINKFCKAASLKFHLKSQLVHKVLLGLEDLFMYHMKFKKIEPKFEKQAQLGKVFQYLDAKSGLNLTLVCKAYRAAYRLPHLRSVLLNCVLPQDVRLQIWMKFLSSVSSCDQRKYCQRP
jgi:hypothetical protein